MFAYTYDAAGRLTTVNDTPTTQGCTIRQYAYDLDSNRVALTSKPPAGDGACQPSVAGATTIPSYDEADRLTTTGIGYDAFGRTLTVPAASAGGSTLTATYYANDRTRALTQDGLTETYTLDPARRIETGVSSGISTATEIDHYNDDSDSPSWIANSSAAGAYTRQIGGMDGGLAAVRDNTGTRLQLANLHGDITAEASASPSATNLLRRSDNDEYGIPRSQQTNRNQWLASRQRPTELKSGAMAMGQRTYVPQLGRFLQVDPVMGGSATTYDYANQDPVNGFDLDGRSAAKRSTMCGVNPDDVNFGSYGPGTGMIAYNLWGVALARCKHAVSDLRVGVQIVGGYVGTELDVIRMGHTQTVSCYGTHRECTGAFAHSGTGFVSCGTLEGQIRFIFRLSWSYKGQERYRNQKQRLPITINGHCE